MLMIELLFNIIGILLICVFVYFIFEMLRTTLLIHKMKLDKNEFPLFWPNYDFRDFLKARWYLKKATFSFHKADFEKNFKLFVEAAILSRDMPLNVKAQIRKNIRHIRFVTQSLRKFIVFLIIVFAVGIIVAFFYQLIHFI